VRTKMSEEGKEEGTDVPVGKTAVHFDDPLLQALVDAQLSGDQVRIDELREKYNKVRCGRTCT